MHMSTGVQSAEEGLDPLEQELQAACRGTELHFLQEQNVLQTPEPFLQPYLLAFQKGLRLASNSLCHQGCL